MYKMYKIQQRGLDSAMMFEMDIPGKGAKSMYFTVFLLTLIMSLGW